MWFENMDVFYDWGYLGLFLLSFVAATVVPVSPEAFVVVLYSQDYDAFLLIIVASTGGYLGSLTYYYFAVRGRNLVTNRIVSISPERLANYQARFERWGAIILLFSWVPFVGEPLIIVSGILKVRLSVFTFWVILGRVFRFSLLLFLSDTIIFRYL